MACGKLSLKDEEAGGERNKRYARKCIGTGNLFVRKCGKEDLERK